MGLKPTLLDQDPDLHRFIHLELQRQRETLELIASENIVSPLVLEAAATVLTNKYAEGYPSARYYGGCEEVDKVESLAIERVKKLFNAEHANVQPHSGSQANQAVYLALLNPKDKVLALNLPDGGHLTHGSPVNASGKFYDFSYYRLDDKNHIDYDNVRKMALQERPRLIIAGGSAYSRIIDFQEFRKIADEVGAYLMVDMAHYAGLIAAGVYPSPIPHAHVCTSTTHKTLRGPRGGLILCTQDLATKIDKAVFPGLQGGPLEHIIAAKAAAFKEASSPLFKTYAQQIVKNARVLSDSLIKKGFSVVSGGTDCHLLLLDLTPQNITGKEAQSLLDTVNITTNKNTIPNDKRGPLVTSGLRIGTPAVTTRGMKETEMEITASLIHSAIEKRNSPEDLKKIKEQTRDLCNRFPIYQEIK